MNVGMAGNCHLDLVEDTPLLHLSAPATTLLPYYAPDLHLLPHTPNCWQAILPLSPFWETSSSTL